MADQDDAAIEASVSELLGGFGPGEARTDDDERLRGRAHESLLVVGPGTPAPAPASSPDEQSYDRRPAGEGDQETEGPGDEDDEIRPQPPRNTACGHG